MEFKHIWKIYASMWFATAIAVSVGIYFTHSAWCLWALLLPACSNLKIENNADEEISKDEHDRNY